MLLGRPLVHDDASFARSTALSLCFAHGMSSRSAEIYRNCVCRGLRARVGETSRLSANARCGQDVTPHLSCSAQSEGFWNSVDSSLLRQRERPDGRGPLARAATGGRGSVKRPLQTPVEEAVAEGNWHEAAALIEKLLPIRALPDSLQHDHLIKGCKLPST